MKTKKLLAVVLALAMVFSTIATVSVFADDDVKVCVYDTDIDFPMSNTSVVFKSISQETYSGTTDKDGICWIKMPTNEAGTWTISGSECITKEITQTGTVGSEQTFNVVPLRSIYLLVLDEATSSPIEGASVTFEIPKGTDVPDGFKYTGTTNANGACMMDGVPLAVKGNLTISATDYDTYNVEETFTYVNGGNPRYNLTSSTGAASTVAVTVYDDDTSDYVEGASVSFKTLDDTNYSGTTDENGGCVLKGIPLDTVGTWTVEADGYETYTENDTPDGSPKYFFLTPTPAPTYTYEVTFPKGPEQVYISGDGNSWTFTPMTMKSETTATITVDTPFTEYKYTAGAAWQYVEKDAQGGEIHNRTSYANPDVVVSWAAVPPPTATGFPPDSMPTAPTVPADQVKAIYSAIYSTDYSFADWGSGTTYAQEDYGKKITTTDLGYFGFTDFALDCSKMEKLHMDVWFEEAGTFRVVPVHGGEEKGVTVTVGKDEVNLWKSVDIALNEGDLAQVTDWSNVYQIKIDNVPNKTFWVNNIYFYTSKTTSVTGTDYEIYLKAPEMYKDGVVPAVVVAATPGNWDDGTAMEYDEGEDIWHIKLNAASGSKYNFYDLNMGWKNPIQTWDEDSNGWVRLPNLTFGDTTKIQLDYYNPEYRWKEAGDTFYAITNGTAQGDKETNHGYITVGETVAEGETVTVTVKPNEGYQLKSLSYVHTPSAWSVIGDFTGWTGDIPMTETETKVFVSPVLTLSEGALFKVRKNANWDDGNYGGPTPRGSNPYTATIGTAITAASEGENIAVPSAGSYIVTLDLTDSATITVTSASTSVDNPVAITKDANDKYTFKMPDYPVTVTAEFEAEAPELTAPQIPTVAEENVKAIMCDTYTNNLGWYPQGWGGCNWSDKSMSGVNFQYAQTMAWDCFASDWVGAGVADYEKLHFDIWFAEDGNSPVVKLEFNDNPATGEVTIPGTFKAGWNSVNVNVKDVFGEQPMNDLKCLTVKVAKEGGPVAWANILFYNGEYTSIDAPTSAPVPEMPENVEVKDGKIKSGDSVVEVKTVGGTKISSDKLQDVAEAINNTLDNKAVSEFTKSGLDEATEANDEELMSALKALTQDKTAQENLENAKLTKRLELELKGTEVSDLEDPIVEKMTVVVTPVAIAKVEGSTGEVELKTTINDSDIEGKITVRMPIDQKNDSKTAAVYDKNGKFLGNFEVKEEDGNKFVEFKTESAGEFTYITLNEKTAGATANGTLYASVEDALSEITDGQTVELTKDVTEKVTVNKTGTFTINDNGHSIEIEAGKGLKLTKNGNIYTVEEIGSNPEMPKQTEVTQGGEIKSGDTVVEVKSGDGTSIPADKKQAVADEINKTLNNKAVGEFKKSGLEKATEGKESTFKNELKSQTSDQTALANLASAEIKTQLEMKLKSAEVDDPSNPIVEKMTIEVAPFAVAKVMGSAGEVELKTPIKDSDIKEEITVRMPVDQKNDSKTAAVYDKNGKFLGNFEVKEEDGNKFVEFETKTAGEFTYLTLNENTSGAKIGTKLYAKAEDALSEIGDGETMTLTEDVKEPITVSKACTFTVNDNGYKVEIVAGSGYKLTKDGNTYTITKKSSGGGGISGGNSSYTVKFETNGGNALKNVSVKVGQKIGTIEIPKKEGFVFDGWFSDKELTKPYNADDKVTKSTTLYAGWKVDPVRQITLTIGKKEATVFTKEMANDVAPKIVNDRTMLPIRFIAEALGATVDWDGEKQLVTISNEGLKIEITIGKDVAFVNAKEVKLDSPAFIENDRTYLPLRFVAENLGAEVEWLEEAQQVVITKALPEKTTTK